MTIKIDQQITGYSVVTDESEQGQGQQQPQVASSQEEADVVHVTPPDDRPERLEGSTYKIKTPLSEHALYVTINDVIMHEGTGKEHRRPFEIFINSKNMEHFQWIVALTRVLSGVFRKGGDVGFLVEELRSVFDPAGGYFKKGGRYMPSLVAELGEVLEMHLQKIGMIDKPELSGEMKAKKEKAEETGALQNATMCGNCNAVAVVRMDGCNMCLECGDSKCG
ncbi:TSCPD domain-containing protein [Thiohalorhabdus sp.]|uniref:TSCPD domain-containing protein n=1 Tax=Thiohalorhabdus sp. TaxID=3094134 RepID=UPI002FC3983B